MGYREIAKVVDQSKAQGTDRFLLVMMANYASDEGYVCASVRSLMDDLRVDRTTIQRRLRALEDAGEITKAAPPTHIRVDRRPQAYTIVCVTGPQIAAPFKSTGAASGAADGAAQLRRPNEGTEGGDPDSPSGSEDRTSGGHRDPSESQFQRWEREYATASNKIGALVDCYRDLFGTQQWTNRPIGQRIASIWKDYHGAMFQAMFRALAEDPKGDPIDYIVRILQRGDKDQPEDDWPDDYVSEGSLAAQAAGLQERPDGAPAEEDRRREAEGV